MSYSWRVSDSRNGSQIDVKKGMANMEHMQNLGNCGALLCEFVINRYIPVLDALTHV